MAVSLDEWCDTHVKEFKKYDINTLSNTMFFREEIRPFIMDSRYFMSPADGVILYQKVVHLGETIVEIKGKNYTIERVLGDDSLLNGPALVIGIFMTFYDVHVNRMPYNGMLQFKALKSIQSYNIPMLPTEHALFDNDRYRALQEANYLFNNEAMLNTIYNPKLDYKFYLVQIADEDVHVVTHFTTKQNTWFEQNRRFSFIRWGSQVNLVLPLDERFEFETQIPDFYHVQGAIDKLVRIHEVTK